MHNLTGESMNPHHRWNILFSVLLSRNHHNYDQYNLRSFWYLLEFLVVTTEKKRDWYLLDLILSPVKMCIRFVQPPSLWYWLEFLVVVMEEKTYMYLLAIKGFDTFTGEIVNSSQYGLDVTLK
ncbi:hypothetical protein HID58_069619, partial [Brassica napus]